MSDDVMVGTYLGFPVAALAGVGSLPVKEENEQEAARVCFVAATRAMQRLVIEVGGEQLGSERIRRADGAGPLSHWK